MDDMNCSIHKDKICESFCVSFNKYICNLCLPEHKFSLHRTYELTSINFEIQESKSKDIVFPEIKKERKRKKTLKIEEYQEFKQIQYPKCQYCSSEIKSDETKLNCGHVVHTKCLFEY